MVWSAVAKLFDGVTSASCMVRCEALRVRVRWVGTYSGETVGKVYE